MSPLSRRERTDWDVDDSRTIVNSLTPVRPTPTVSFTSIWRAPASVDRFFEGQALEGGVVDAGDEIAAHHPRAPLAPSSG